MADSRPPGGVFFNSPGTSQPAQGSTRAGPATADAVPASFPHTTHTGAETANVNNPGNPDRHSLVASSDATALALF